METNVDIDCADADALSDFSCKALGDTRETRAQRYRR